MTKLRDVLRCIGNSVEIECLKGVWNDRSDKMWTSMYEDLMSVVSADGEDVDTYVH